MHGRPLREPFIPGCQLRTGRPPILFFVAEFQIGDRAGDADSSDIDTITVRSGMVFHICECAVDLAHLASGPFTPPKIIRPQMGLIAQQDGRIQQPIG